MAATSPFTSPTKVVILVDDKFDQDHDAIVAQSQERLRTSRSNTLLSTHYHDDHSGGNGKFLSTAEIISTANARTNIVNHKQSNAPPGDVRRRA